MNMKTSHVLQKISTVLMTIALFIISFFLCFSSQMQTIAVFPEYGVLSGETYDKTVGQYQKLENEKFFSHLTPLERKFLNVTDTYDSLATAKELYESAPDNILFTSLYAQLLIEDFSSFLETPEERPDEQTIKKIIDHWKKIDPDNGMPYFYMDYFEFQTGYKTEEIQQETETIEKYTTVDSAAVERGMKEYRDGLTKKYAKVYAIARQRERLRIAKLPKTPLGILKKIAISASTLLPNLTVERQMTRYLSHYAKELHAKGKIKEAAELTATGKTYLLLRMEEQETYMISALVHIAIKSIWQETAKEIKNQELTDLYTPIREYFQQWKKMPDPNEDTVVKHGGLLAAMLSPALKEKIDPELLKPERMVNYLLMDQVVLMLLFSLVSVLTAGLLFFGLIGLLFKEYPDWTLPAKSCSRIFLYGLIIPLGLYLIYSHVDWLSGRNMNPAWDPLRTAIPHLYLLFVYPLCFVITAFIELKFRLKKNFAGILWNSIGLLTGFLFITTAILAPLYRMEINYYIAQDKLCTFEDGFTVTETEVTRKFYRFMHETLTTKQSGNKK